MLIASEYLQKSLSRIYTYGFIALAISYLPITGFSFASADFSESDKTTIVGAIGVIVIFNIFASIPLFIRDLFQTRILDLTKLDQISLAEATAESDPIAEKLHRIRGPAVFFGFLSFVIEFLLPIAFGVIAIALVWPDVNGLITKFGLTQ